MSSIDAGISTLGPNNHSKHARLLKYEKGSKMTYTHMCQNAYFCTFEVTSGLINLFRATLIIDTQ